MLKAPCKFFEPTNEPFKIWKIASFLLTFFSSQILYYLDIELSLLTSVVWLFVFNLFLKSVLCVTTLVLFIACLFSKSFVKSFSRIV